LYQIEPLSKAGNPIHFRKSLVNQGFSGALGRWANKKPLNLAEQRLLLQLVANQGGGPEKHIQYQFLY
jgi:hypothetical protein